MLRPCSSALLIAVLLAGCSSAPRVEKAVVKAEKDRRKAPNFLLKDMHGQPVQLSDYHGKVVVLNFWATWCAPCKIEIPWFIEFQNNYKGRDFEVLGLSMDDDGWDAVKPYLARSKINYRVLIATDPVTQSYGGVDALPTTFILDREGRIAATHVGLAGKGEYQREILAVLDSKVTTSATEGSVAAIP